MKQQRLLDTMRVGVRDVGWIILMVLGWGMIVLGILAPTVLFLFGVVFNLSRQGAWEANVHDISGLALSAAPFPIGIALLIWAKWLGTTADGMGK